MSIQDQAEAVNAGIKILIGIGGTASSFYLEHIHTLAGILAALGTAAFMWAQFFKLIRKNKKKGDKND